MKTWLQLASTNALGTARTLKDRVVIQSCGEPVTQAYLLREGVAEIFQENKVGNSVVVKVITAPTIIGSPELLANEPLYLAHSRVVKGAVVHALEASRYFEILREHPSAAFESMSDVSQAFCGAARFESSRLYESEVLLAAILTAYAEVFGTTTEQGVRVELIRSQADLAGAIGATERSVNRVFTKWSEEGLISKAFRKFTLHRPDEMAAIAGELAGSLVHRWHELPSELSSLVPALGLKQREG